MDETQQQAPWSQALGMQIPDPAQPQPSSQFAQMVQPQAPMPIAKPAGNAEELAARKSGWDTLMSNPNFKTALMFAGAHMAQPMLIGQNGLGHLASSVATGATAMQAGEYDSYQQQLKATEEARKQSESQAHVRSMEAGTARTEAGTPGVAAESDVAVATKGAKIEAADTAAAKAKVDLAKATDDAAVSKVENELRTRRAAIEKGIPDEKVRAAEVAKIDAAILSVDEARARLKASKSSSDASDALTKERGVETESKQLTLDVLKKMPADEQKQFLTKTGKYSQHTSGIGQQATMWGDIYDKLPADDAAKKGKTREQFQMDKLSSAKTKDAGDTLTKYLAVGGDDPDVIQGLTDLLKEGISAKRNPSGSAAPASGASGVKPTVTDVAGYQKLPKGTRYIDPRGVERIKQ